MPTRSIRGAQLNPTEPTDPALSRIGRGPASQSGAGDLGMFGPLPAIVGGVAIAGIAIGGAQASENAGGGSFALVGEAAGGASAVGAFDLAGADMPVDGAGQADDSLTLPAPSASMTAQSLDRASLDPAMQPSVFAAPVSMPVLPHVVSIAPVAAEAPAPMATAANAAPPGVAAASVADAMETVRASAEQLTGALAVLAAQVGNAPAPAVAALETVQVQVGALTTQADTLVQGAAGTAQALADTATASVENVTASIADTAAQTLGAVAATTADLTATVATTTASAAELVGTVTATAAETVATAQATATDLAAAAAGTATAAVSQATAAADTAVAAATDITVAALAAIPGTVAGVTQTVGGVTDVVADVTDLAGSDPVAGIATLAGLLADTDGYALRDPGSGDTVFTSAIPVAEPVEALLADIADIPDLTPPDALLGVADDVAGKLGGLLGGIGNHDEDGHG